MTENQALAKQTIELERELTSLEDKIANEDNELNQLIYSLYGLNEKEISFIESG